MEKTQIKTDADLYLFTSINYTQARNRKLETDKTRKPDASKTRKPEASI